LWAFFFVHPFQKGWAKSTHTLPLSSFFPFPLIYINYRTIYKSITHQLLLFKSIHYSTFYIITHWSVLTIVQSIKVLHTNCYSSNPYITPHSTSSLVAWSIIKIPKNRVLCKCLLFPWLNNDDSQKNSILYYIINRCPLIHKGHRDHMWPLGWISFISVYVVITYTCKVVFHSSFLPSLLCEVIDILC
jgi:hypothetical protein